MLNKAIIEGRLTKDITITRTKNGNAVANFQLAVSDYKNDCQFLDVVAFDKLAEALGKFGKKGTLVLVDGYLQKQSYKTKTGQNATKIQIVCYTAECLNTSKKEEKEEINSTATSAQVESNEEPSVSQEEDYSNESFDFDYDDDLPF